MKWIVAVLGGLLALAGAMTIQQNLGIIQVERGWSSVISGSVVMSAGFVVLALAAVVARLETITASLARRPHAWPAHTLDDEEDAAEAGDAAPKRESGLRSVLRQGRDLGIGVAPVPPPPREIPVEPLPMHTSTAVEENDDEIAYERFAPRFGPVTDRDVNAPEQPRSDALEPEEERREQADAAPATSSLRGFRFHFPPLADPAKRTSPDETVPAGGVEAVSLRGAMDLPASEAEVGRGDEQQGAQEDERVHDLEPAPSGSAIAEEDTAEVTETADERVYAGSGDIQTDELGMAREDSRQVEVAASETPPSVEAVAEPSKPARKPSLFPLRWQRPSGDDAILAPRKEDESPPEVAVSTNGTATSHLESETRGQEDDARSESGEQKSAAIRAGNGSATPIRAPVQDTDWLERALSGVDEPPPSRGFAPKTLPRAEYPLPVAAPAIVAPPPAPEPPPPESAPPRPDILGRYEAQGTSYVMYSDGSIEAETSAGTFRFSSLTELKRFVEQRA